MTTAADGKYCFIELTHQLKELQKDAVTEVITLTPNHRMPEMGSYGLTQPCSTLSNATLEAMVPVINHWASRQGMVITGHPTRLMFCPEAFRLERSCCLVPAPGHTVLLVPLMNVPTSISLISEGNPVKDETWTPDKLLLLSDLGIQLNSYGNARFMFLMYHKDTIHRRRCGQPRKV
ncbi:hypothetical protein AK830_g11311 [Neonectria ditissima]|uniref:Uncharacterized protein n=1 Tax=Neonectria ditissima TaxID=78410 RepID=A0A0P7B3E4_9HYPO|nr:hypothetical protein AK830_g11311 [Neonectria ditissima]